MNLGELIPKGVYTQKKALEYEACVPRIRFKIGIACQNIHKIL